MQFKTIATKPQSVPGSDRISPSPSPSLVRSLSFSRPLTLRQTRSLTHSLLLTRSHSHCLTHSRSLAGHGVRGGRPARPAGAGHSVLGRIPVWNAAPKNGHQIMGGPASRHGSLNSGCLTSTFLALFLSHALSPSGRPRSARRPSGAPSGGVGFGTCPSNPRYLNPYVYIIQHMYVS